MQIEENKSLLRHNTLGVPATAAYFAHARSLADIVEALTWAEMNAVRVCVLGGGSNVILQNHIDALVLVPALEGIELLHQYETDNHYFLRAGAGENWHQFVVYCVTHGYYGIENLALIPGNVGAAPIQNIGAYGVELKDVFFQLDALDIVTKTRRKFSLDDCAFRYRESIFKGELKNRYVILSVTFRLAKADCPTLSYPALKSALGSDQSASAQHVMDTVIRIRQSRLPNPQQLPNAGSFFKNPIVSAQAATAIQQKYSDAPIFDADGDYKKLAAAWLIERAGWKGKEKYGIKVHPDHALVLTNPNHCNAAAILRAANDIKQDVRNLFNVELELEPQQLIH